MNQNFAFSALFRVIQILGISPFEFNRKFRPFSGIRMRIYSLLNLIFCVVSLGGLYYEKNLYLKSHLNYIENVVSFVQLVAVKISHLIIVGEAFHHRNLMVEFTEGLINIDKAMEEIGVKIRFRRNRRINFMVLALFSGFIFTCALSSSCLKWTFEGDEMLKYSISFYVPFILMNYRYFAIFNFIWTIRERTKMLNGKLSTIQLNHDDFVNFKHSRQITTLSLTVLFKNCNELAGKSINNFDELISLRNIYDKVYKLSVQLNYSFGLSSLFNVSVDFILMTSQVYFISVLLLKSSFGSKDKVDLVVCICYFLPSFTNILIYCTICHLANQTVS